jgi:hypothetical protein
MINAEGVVKEKQKVLFDEKYSKQWEEQEEEEEKIDSGIETPGLYDLLKTFVTIKTSTYKIKTPGLYDDEQTEILKRYCESRRPASLGVINCLENGADPNAIVGKNKSRPLHAFARLGNTSVIEYLIKAGADVNIQNTQIQTPLMIACDTKRCDSGQLGVVRLLLSQKGINLNVTDVGGNTALLNAIFRNNVYITR